MDLSMVKSQFYRLHNWVFVDLLAEAYIWTMVEFLYTEAFMHLFNNGNNNIHVYFTKSGTEVGL